MDNIIYEYMPKRTTKRELALISIFIAAAIGFFTVPTLFQDMQIAWLFQTSALASFCGAIFIYTEFLSKDRLYRIVENDDGKLVFTVSELMSKGRKTMMVCCFSLDCIESVSVFDNSSPSDLKRKKEFVSVAKKENRRRFSFYPEMTPIEICSVLVYENKEKMLVNVVADKELVEKFLEAAERNAVSVDTDETV